MDIEALGSPGWDRWTSEDVALAFVGDEPEGPGAGAGLGIGDEIS
jgi:hypothetical protein